MHRARVIKHLLQCRDPAVHGLRVSNELVGPTLGNDSGRADHDLGFRDHGVCGWLALLQRRIKHGRHSDIH